MTKDRILVVEDDPAMQEILAIGLRAMGFEILRADDLSMSYLALAKSQPSIILADYQLPDGTAFELLAWLKARDIRIPLVVLTAHTQIELAVEAIKNGAEQFVPKPVDMELLATSLRRTLENCRNRKKTLAHGLERARYERGPFLGNSTAIKELSKAAKRVSEASNTVLIQGETGTGKGVLALWLHKNGPRSSEPFIALNCAGLSRELLESEIFGHVKGAFTGALMNKLGFLDAANRGVLFLDEIGDMDINAQAKILKVVEEKRFYRLGDVHERMVDIQIIAASHRDLKALVKEGKFREDLYFRISTLRLRTPPLRERLEDIPVITDRLLEQLSWDMNRGSLRISDTARMELQLYPWPGNIRELRNVLERAALLSDDGVIHETGLEFEYPIVREVEERADREHLTLREMEERQIIEALRSEGGRVAKAAKRLGIPRSTLYAKIREYGL